MRRRRMLLVIVGIAALAPGVEGIAAHPAVARSGRQARPGLPSAAAVSTPAKPTGVLRGRVLAAEGGAPLRRARVTLNAPGMRESRATTTDLDGRWEFTELRAGRYQLSAAKPPYVSLEYGQRIPTEPGKPIELKDGQSLERIEFRLPRGAVIAGRLLDDLGEPAAFVVVQALRMQYVRGRRQLGATGAMVRTDDLGNFRLFGLPPGAYYVGTTATLWGSEAAEDIGISFGASYYPGTLDAAQAQAVEVRVGQDRSNVDFRLSPVKLARLSGRVLDQQGAAVANANVLMMQERVGANMMTVTTMAAATTDAQGAFLITNVAPGEYSLVSLGSSPSYSAAAERGSLEVSVNGEDLDGLLVAVTRGSRASGQIEFEGEERPPSAGAVRVFAVEPGGGRGMSLPGTSTVSADWSFELAGISPGERVFRVAGLPTGYGLKSVMVDDREVVDTPLPFDGKEEMNGVRLIVTRRVPALTGSVSDDRGRPLREYSVVAFAADPKKRGPGTRFIGTARPDQEGRFTITTLPPGDYLVVALEYLETGDAEDPAVLESLRARATPVTLTEGERKAVELKVVPR